MERSEHKIDGRIYCEVVRNNRSNLIKGLLRRIAPRNDGDL